MFKCSKPPTSHLIVQTCAELGQISTTLERHVTCDTPPIMRIHAANDSFHPSSVMCWFHSNSTCANLCPQAGKDQVSCSTCVYAYIIICIHIYIYILYTYIHIYIYIFILYTDIYIYINFSLCIAICCALQ